MKSTSAIPSVSHLALLCFISLIIRLIRDPNENAGDTKSYLNELFTVSRAQPSSALAQGRSSNWREFTWRN